MQVGSGYLKRTKQLKLWLVLAVVDIIKVHDPNVILKPAQVNV